MKENQKKISLTTYVLSLIIMLAIIIGLIFMYLNKSTNHIQTSTNLEKNITTYKTVKSKKTVWEDYPSTLTEEISQWLLGDKTAWDTSFQTQTMKKTLYSLSKKYPTSTECPFTEDFLSHLYIGNSTRIVDTESNYKQYEYDSDDEFINGYNIEKYTDIISYKIAATTGIIKTLIPILTHISLFLTNENKTALIIITYKTKLSSQFLSYFELFLTFFIVSISPLLRQFITLC